MLDGNIPSRILGLVLRSLLLPSVVPNKPKSLRAAIELRYVACTVRRRAGHTIRPLMYAYAPGRRKIKVPVLAGGTGPDQASFRLRSAEMALMGKVSIESMRQRIGR